MFLQRCINISYKSLIEQYITHLSATLVEVGEMYFFILVAT